MFRNSVAFHLYTIHRKCDYHRCVYFKIPIATSNAAAVQIRGWVAKFSIKTGGVYIQYVLLIFYVKARFTSSFGL